MEVIIAGPRGMRLRTIVPESRVERARGLLGGPAPRHDRALLLERARSIHTFGMRSEIRVALLDDGFVVVRVLDLPPGRLVLPRRRTRHVLECSRRADVRNGDQLCVTRSPPDRWSR